MRTQLVFAVLLSVTFSLLADSASAAQTTFDMKWPVSGPATSRVGPRNGRIHAGRDIACVNVPVRAAYDGTVTRRAYDANGYGFYMDVTHASGYSTRYAHLSRYVASLNQRVKLGDQIAVSGNTGRSTGPHLHFEIRRYGAVQTPYWDAQIPLTAHRHIDFIPVDFPGLGGPTTPVLRGIVYDLAKGTSARIAGATVSLENGSFKITDAAGAFAFTLPAGTYRFGGSAPGYHANWRSQTVPGTGEVWGSFGLRAADVPAMTCNPSPIVARSLDITVRGDVRSPVAMIVGARPRFPLLDLRASGLGMLWPRLDGAVVLNLGTIPTTGILRSDLTAPITSRGMRVHLQSVVLRQSGIRLTNGVALQVP